MDHVVQKHRAFQRLVESVAAAQSSEQKTSKELGFLHLVERSCYALYIEIDRREKEGYVLLGVINRIPNSENFEAHMRKPVLDKDVLAI